MFLDFIADAVEDSANLAAQAVDVAHRTQNGVFDATGVNGIIPTSIRNLNDRVYDTNENLIREAGHDTTTLLREFDDSGSSKQPHDEENQESEPDNEPGQTIKKPQGDHVNKTPGGHVDLRSGCPEVYSQGHMMSCTAHAVAAAFEFAVKKQRLPEFSPSRLFIWYNARKESGHTEYDVGSNLRDAIKSLDLKAHGVCSEGDWPYEISESNEKTHKFPPDAKAATKPPILAENHAHQHTAPKYKSFKMDKDLRKNLIKCLDKGDPFVFGMKTYGLLKGDQIHSNGHGLRQPKTREMKDEHRHSLLAVGYKQDEEMFIVRNSWGANWGQGGYFYMPYKYLQHCYEFWTIRLVDSPPERP
ncbi:cysteine proteinase [Hypoxylon crocopeplum]|nr:cysteine proteinase [Hypoxylon crocopeplum]